MSVMQGSDKLTGALLRDRERKATQPARRLTAD
jgi:hypothetical protein